MSFLEVSFYVRFKFKGKNGFTFIELIVSLAIVLFLFFLSLPNVSFLTEKTNKQIARQLLIEYALKMERSLFRYDQEMGSDDDGFSEYFEASCLAFKKNILERPQVLSIKPSFKCRLFDSNTAFELQLIFPSVIFSLDSYGINKEIEKK